MKQMSCCLILASVLATLTLIAVPFKEWYATHGLKLEAHYDRGRP